jgi:PAS domain S-box-containing protein
MSPERPAADLLETLLADPRVASRSIHDSISLDQTLDAGLSDFLMQSSHADKRAGMTDSDNDSDLIELPKRTLIDPAGEFDRMFDYRLVGPIGRGGTGIVFQAHQRAINREVAIKVLRDHLRRDPMARQRFLAEARTIGGLDHPNVIAIHELAIGDDGRLFYSMKRIDGTAWSEVYFNKSSEENLTILLRVADALRYAHSRGIIHRDIKPANVMLGRYGEVLVADWGLALVHPPQLEASSGSTSIGGTPAYMAPELALGELDKIGPQTDVYLLGATLFQLLTGFPPHEGASLIECIRNAGDNRIRITSQQSELMDIALTAMATRPQDRFANVEQFQQAIHDYQQHQESIALVRRAQKHAEEAAESPTYERYSLAISLAREAIDIWSDNKRAKTMLHRLRIDFAQLAAEQDDLDLSLSLLESAGEEDSELAASIRYRREQREARFEREERYSTLFANSPDAVLVTRLADGTVLEANETFLRMFEHRREDIVGVRVADFHLWVHPERRGDFIRQIRETGRADNFETILRTRLNREIPVLISARRTELDGDTLVVAHTRDITLRRAAEDELRRSQTRLREVQQLANLGTWEINLETGKIYWSEETYRIAGIVPGKEPPDLAGYLSLVHPADRVRAEAALKNAIENGAAYQLQVRHLRPDGSYNTTITRGQPILNSAGRTVELYGTVLDISDRKQLEDQLNQQIRRLQLLIDVQGKPLIALSREGILLAASVQVRESLGRDSTCFRNQWHFLADTDFDFALLRDACVVTGHFATDCQPVGDRFTVRLQPLEDIIYGEILS